MLGALSSRRCSRRGSAADPDAEAAKAAKQRAKQRGRKKGGKTTAGKTLTQAGSSRVGKTTGGRNATQAGRSLGGKNQSRVDKQRGGHRGAAVLRATLGQLSLASSASFGSACSCSVRQRKRLAIIQHQVVSVWAANAQDVVTGPLILLQGTERSGNGKDRCPR